MQEKNKSVAGAEAKVEESQVGQWEAFARNMVRLFDQGTKAARHSGRAPAERAGSLQHGRGGRRGGQVARRGRAAMGEPSRQVRRGAERALQGYADLWGRSVRRFLGEEDVKPVVEPEPGDNRFKDPDWSNSQFFDFWKQAYLITSRWAEDVTRNTEGVDEKTRKKALFYLNQMLAALSPSNFALHQPRSGPHHARHQRRAIWCRAWRISSQDLEQSKDLLRISQTDLVGLRDRTEPRGDARQGRVPERPHPAHPIRADDGGGVRAAAPGRAALDQQVLHSRSRAGESLRQMGGRAGLHRVPRLVGQPRREARAEDLRRLHARRHPRRGRRRHPPDRQPQDQCARLLRRRHAARLHARLYGGQGATTASPRRASSPRRSISARPATSSCSSTMRSSSRSKR